MDIPGIVLLVFSGLAALIAGGGLIIFGRHQSRKRMKKQADHARAVSIRQEQEQKDRLWSEDFLHRKAKETTCLKFEEVARLKDEEATRIRTEEEARTKAKEEANRQAEEDARIKAEKEKRQVEESAHLKAEEERRQAEEASRFKSEEEKRQAEEAARIKAEEARLQTEETARFKAEEEARLKAEETARFKAEEEARLKAEEEADRLTAKEAARLKAEEEARLLAEEAARLKAEEEARLQAVEAARLKAEEEEARLQTEEAARREKTRKGKRVEPVNRVGRHRATEKVSLSKPAGNYSHNIDVVCWEKTRQWHLCVELSDEILDANDEIEIRQNNSRLKKSSYQENWWNLNQSFGEIVIRDRDGEILDGLNLGEENQGCIIFKLVGESRSFGRKVKHTSSGMYLLVAPDTWVPADSSCFSEETLSIPSYRAWFFVSENSTGRTLVFNDPDGNPVGLPVKTQQFFLTGNQLIDAGEFGGPLFGTAPPCIQKPGEQTWNEVDTIILGEEGPGRNRWRMEFQPRQDDIVQKLPADLLKRNIGWYFLRFYNSEQDLIETLDFRYVRDISNIKLPQFQVPTEKDGYMPAVVEITHSQNCSLLCSEENSKEFHIDILPEGSKIAISPNQGDDKSRWLVECPDGKIELTILIEHIWWGISENNTSPSEWMDKPVSLSRNDISAVSSKMLWIRFPERNWCDGVSVGFHKRLAGYYPLAGMEGILSIPFRVFSGVEERNRAGSWRLKVWVDTPEKSHEMTVADLSVLMICKQCNNSIPDSDISSHLSGHLDDIIRPLNYEEMRKFLPHLPKMIYKCSYCNYYAGDNESHITSAMEQHIELSCRKVNRSGGPAKIAFSKITNLDEIRDNYDRNLPHIYKCKECGQIFCDVPDAERSDHLIQKHGNLLVRFQ